MKSLKVLVVDSNIVLTDKLIDKIDDIENYEAVVIRGQRPYSEDAVYLQESLGNEIFGVPCKRKSDEEILKDIDSRKHRRISGFMSTVLVLAASGMSEMSEPYCLSILKYLEGPDIFRESKNYDKNYKKWNIKQRKPYDTRNQTRLYRHSR